MKAIVIEGFGDPAATIRLKDLPEPAAPGPGEVTVEMLVLNINPSDLLQIQGLYGTSRPPLPFIPGSEYAGVVEAIGDGVAGFAVGDRVFGSSLGGPCAEIGNFRAENVSKVPAGMSLEEAAVFPVNYQTAWHALVDRGQAKAGETLLVLGAAGGTGYAAVEVGKYLGLRVIASASSAEKQEAARRGGADAVVKTGAEDWRDQVKAANDGREIDLVFDPVGGEATDPAFRTLGYGGRHLVIGFTAGLTALKTNLPLLKCASLVGVQMRGHALSRPEEAAANRVKVMALAGEGHFHPAIAGRYPLESYAEAMRAAFSGKAAGRIVLTMS